MTAGLIIAIASGTRLSPMMSTMQLVATASMAVAVVSFVTAASLQPRPRISDVDDVEPPEGAGGLPETVQSLLLGSLALLAGAVAFAFAGLLLRSGPSAQSVAFCQVFFLGAAASGFTFMLFSKVAPRRGGN
jgi:drug/metabolite transporter (DMT)-like permease